MKKLYISIAFLICTLNAVAQYSVRLAANASVGVNPNIETYFFAEKLAVEHIGNYVFDIKGVDYSHQPVVHFGFKNFQRYQNDPIIIRVADILKQIRDTLYDNGPILNYLLSQKDFPAKGPRFANNDKKLSTSANDNKLNALYLELTDSLRSFYLKAHVAEFLTQNRPFYTGALQEIAKDINKSAYAAIENWYGKRFPRYELYISPAMPITPGDDSYRGFGPSIVSPGGKIPAMVFSSSKMLPTLNSMPLYRQYGFDNLNVTQFITIHEISHSFVNPLLDKYVDQLNADSALFIKELKDTLAPRGIRDWNVCVIEHIVRLGEIRIARSTGNVKEAKRLRNLHIGESNFILIPLLEEKIVEYEAKRAKYPTFDGYVPELIKFLHNLTPEIVNDQWLKFQNYKVALD